MRVCVAYKDIAEACKLFSAFAESKGFTLKNDVFTVYEGEQVVGGALYQGNTYVSFVLDRNSDGLEEAMHSVSIPMTGTMVLFDMNLDKAHNILVNRSGIDIKYKPRYLLHDGLLECLLRGGCVTITWFGGEEVTTHALAVATKLKGACTQV